MKFIVILSVIIAGCIAKPLDDSANAQILRYEVINKITFCMIITIIIFFFLLQNDNIGIDGYKFA
jgi:hypothetical protein